MLLPIKPFIVIDDCNQCPIAFIWPDQAAGGYVNGSTLNVNTTSGGMVVLEFKDDRAAVRALQTVIDLTTRHREDYIWRDQEQVILGTNGRPIDKELLDPRETLEDEDYEEDSSVPVARLRCIRESCNWVGPNIPIGKIDRSTRCGKCNGPAWVEVMSNDPVLRYKCTNGDCGWESAPIDQKRAEKPLPKCPYCDSNTQLMESKK